MDRENSYRLWWLLEDDNGLQYTEWHEEISLSDYEIIYGNVTDKIVEMELRLNGEATCLECISE